MLHEAWWGRTYEIDPATGKVTLYRPLPFPMPIEDKFRLLQAEALRKRHEWWRVSEFLP